MDAGTLAGAVVLVADKERVLAMESVGYADIASQVAMSADAVFWIASTTKPMTATALMMLVDEEKVDLAAPVEQYLPEFAGQMLIAEQDEQHSVLRRPARPITVADVLSHTSWLPFMSRVERVIDGRPLREAVVSYAMTPLASEPGTKYQYSNAGINTAGRIIEVVSGVPYEHFMQARLFSPLGMSDTTFFPDGRQIKRLARSYKAGPSNVGLEETPIGQFTLPLTMAGRYACPAGGLFSTAADVARFGRMILNGGLLDGRRYVSEAAVAQMTSTQTGMLLSKDGDETGYGFGFATARRSNGRAPAGECGHGGAYGNDLSIDPDRGLVRVWMVQHASYPNDGGKLVKAAFMEAVAAKFN